MPELNAAYAHLPLDRLRGLRSVLGQEEGRVSYWRRVLQARLDLLDADTARAGAGLPVQQLRRALTEERLGAGRAALVQVLSEHAVPPLPALAELWDRQASPEDPEARSALQSDLAQAERELSDYRGALHVRLAEVTDELIARYRFAPTLALSALPATSRARRPRSS